MIAVDTSAVVAIVLGEPEAEALAQALMRQPSKMSTASFLEAAMVVESRQGRDATRDLDLLIVDGGVTLTPPDQSQMATAIRAWRRFGKGRHAAGLTFGDCFAYALAKTRDLPLLFTGDDFTQTDLRLDEW